MIHSNTAQEIEQILNDKFEPQLLEIIDESGHHVGHEGIRQTPKAGHYKVVIASSLFVGKSLIEQHRMVNTALEHLMPEFIHALKISTKSVK